MPHPAAKEQQQILSKLHQKQSRFFFFKTACIGAVFHYLLEQPNLKSELNPRAPILMQMTSSWISKTCWVIVDSLGVAFREVGSQSWEESRARARDQKSPLEGPVWYRGLDS